MLSVVWLVVRGLEARRDLDAAADGIQQVRVDLLAADSARASSDLSSADRNADAARRETHDPVWSVAGHIPFLGRPVRSVAGIGRIASNLTSDTFPTLVRTAGVVSSQRISLAHGSVNLPTLGAQAAPLASADSAVAHDLGDAQGLPRADVGPIDAARERLVTELGALSGEVHAAAVTARIGPAMLGSEGPRTYFVAFQNSAEARGTGGIAGAYVILRAEAGHLSVQQSGSDADLQDDLPPVATAGNLGPVAEAAGATHIWRNANVGADFPTAASTWVGLWQEQTQQHLDGAFAVDPTVLSYLLAVTGPTRLANGQIVDASNAVALTEQTVYDTFGSARSDRQSFLQEISSATVTTVLNAPGSQSQGLLQALRRSAGQNRLLIYSTVPDEQTALLTTPAGGGLPPTDRPSALLSLVNASGNKIDYFVRSDLTYRARTCAGTTRAVTVTVAITDTAPTSGLRSVVTARLDGGAGPPGSELSLVSYYATSGAGLDSAELDGHQTTVNVSAQGGHPVFTLPITLLPGGQSHTLVLHLTEPVLAGQVQTRPQALVQPQSVTVDAPTCHS